MTYRPRTEEEKAASRKASREAFARHIAESRGITVEEHLRRMSRDAAERALVLREEGLEEDEEE